MNGTTSEMYLKGAAAGRRWAESLATEAAVDNLAELRDTVTDECPEIWEQAFPMTGKAGRWRTAAGTTVDGAALIASIASGDGNNINPDISPQFWQVAAGLTGGRRLQSGGWLRGFIDGAISTKRGN